MLIFYPASFEVEELRCFKKRQRIDFTNEEGILPQWTVIVGENGTGKTTLLQLVAMMMPTESDLLATLSPRLFHDTKNFSLRFNKEIRSGIKGTRLFQEFAYSTDLGTRPKKLVKLSLESLEGSISVPPLVEGIKIRSKLYAYGAYRRSHTNTSLKPPQDEGIESLFVQDHPLINPIEWLLRQDYLAKSSNELGHTHAIERVKEVLRKLLPDVEKFIFTADAFAQGIDAQLRPPYGIDVLFETPYGTVSFDQLSDGHATVMTWVVDFCARQMRAFPESDDIFLEPAVVLIDEFAMHMHPKWQREAIAFLSDTFPNVQFIVTSHSPLILQAAPNANIVLLERKEDHVEVRNDLDALADWRIDQLLTSDLFGLTTARPPRFEKIMSSRQSILIKDELTDEDWADLERLDRELEEMAPSMESAIERNLVKRALKIVEKQEEA